MRQQQNKRRASRKWWRRLVRFWDSDFDFIVDAGDQIDEELRFHIDERKAKLIQEGCDPLAAMHEAERRFGDVSQHRNACLKGAGYPYYLTCFRVVTLVVFFALGALMVFMGVVRSRPSRDGAIDQPQVSPLPFLSADATVGARTRGWTHAGFLGHWSESHVNQLETSDREVVVALTDTFSTSEFTTTLLAEDEFEEPREGHDNGAQPQAYVVWARPDREHAAQSLPTTGLVFFSKPIIGYQLRRPTRAVDVQLDYVSGFTEPAPGVRIKLNEDKLGMFLILEPEAEPFCLSILTSSQPGGPVDVADGKTFTAALDAACPKERVRLATVLLETRVDSDSPGHHELPIVKLQNQVIERILFGDLKPPADAEPWELALLARAAHHFAHRLLCERDLTRVLQISEQFLDAAEKTKDIHPNELFALQCYRTCALMELGRYENAKQIAFSEIERGQKFGDLLYLPNFYSFLTEIADREGDAGKANDYLEASMVIAKRRNNANAYLVAASQLAKRLMLGNDFDNLNDLLAKIENVKVNNPDSVASHKLECFGAIAEAHSGSQSDKYEAVIRRARAGLDDVPQRAHYMYFFTIYFVEKACGRDIALAFWANQRCLECCQGNPHYTNLERLNQAYLLDRMNRRQEAIALLESLEGRFEQAATSEIERLRMLSQLYAELPDYRDRLEPVIDRLFALQSKIEKADSRSRRQLMLGL